MSAALARHRWTILGLAALLLAIAASYPQVRRIYAAQRAAARRADSAAARPRAQPTEPRQSALMQPPGESREAAGVSAQSTLRQCLAQARAADAIKWDRMCAYVAERNAAEFANCKQQGQADSYCRSLYASTPAKDCLLPHAMASSIEEAGQSAASDCYRQYQRTATDR